MAAQAILAVAIGDSRKNKIIQDGSSGSLSGVRPYIKGIVNKLTSWGDNIGANKDYVIDYREGNFTQVTNIFSSLTDGRPPPDVIFCMSKTVLDAAVAKINTTPIVGIVSKHNTYGKNVFGVSAKRSQIAHRYYDHFLDTIPSLKHQQGAHIYILSRANYDPATDSINDITAHNTPVPIDVREVPSPFGETDIKGVIDNIARNSGGLLVLPVDYFFGSADKIISWARARMLPDFWPATDWVQNTPSSALGGYGASQERCGQLLGDKIHVLLAKQKPSPPFTDITHDANFTWLASTKAATALNVALGNQVPTI